ncbi:MAG: protease inhibitor I42 family protein [Desulfatitalea sp.]
MKVFSFIGMMLLWVGLMSFNGWAGDRPTAVEDRTMSDVVVAQDANGKEQQVVLGQRVLIRLAENPTTGYQWEIEACDARVLTPAGSDFAATPGGALGAGGLRTFVFKVLAPGQATVRLIYRRGWEPKEQAIDRFVIRIDVREKAPS